jgi:hypothetical protein
MTLISDITCKLMNHHGKARHFTTNTSHTQKANFPIDTQNTQGKVKGQILSWPHQDKLKSSKAKKTTINVSYHQCFQFQ